MGYSLKFAISLHAMWRQNKIKGGRYSRGTFIEKKTYCKSINCIKRDEISIIWDKVSIISGMVLDRAFFFLYCTTGEEFRSFNYSDTIGIHQLQEKGVEVKVLAGKFVEIYKYNSVFSAWGGGSLWGQFALKKKFLPPDIETASLRKFPSPTKIFLSPENVNNILLPGQYVVSR